MVTQEPYAELVKYLNAFVLIHESRRRRRASSSSSRSGDKSDPSIIAAKAPDALGQDPPGAIGKHAAPSMRKRSEATRDTPQKFDRLIRAAVANDAMARTCKRRSGPQP